MSKRQRLQRPAKTSGDQYPSFQSLGCQSHIGAGRSEIFTTPLFHGCAPRFVEDCRTSLENYNLWRTNHTAHAVGLHLTSIPKR